MLPAHCPSEQKMYETLFDQQGERLIERGWHQALEMKKEDIHLWLGMLRDRFGEIGEVPPDHVPFLIVVPHGMLPVAKQMELLVVAEKHGYAGLDGEGLVNFEGLGSSKFPYLACDVEDGTATVGQATDEAAKSIRNICRYGLTVEEAIALATHSPDSLAHHALALIDSNFQRCIPELWLSAGGPTLNFNWLRSRREDRGVPSCARRLMLV